MTTPLDPEAIAATLPSMTLAEVRDRLALGQTPARIRAEAGLLAEGLPVLDGLRKAGLLPLTPPAGAGLRKAGLLPEAPPVAALARYHEQIEKVVPAELVEGEATP